MTHLTLQANFEEGAQDYEDVIDAYEQIPQVDKFHAFFKAQFLPKVSPEEHLCGLEEENIY